MSIEPGQWYILGALILAAPHLSPRSARFAVILFIVLALIAMLRRAFE